MNYIDPSTLHLVLSPKLIVNMSQIICPRCKILHAALGRIVLCLISLLTDLTHLSDH